MSDCSSSDDEPLLDSPGESSNDDRSTSGDELQVFTFKAVQFQKKEQPNCSEQPNPSSTTKRKLQANSSAVDSTTNKRPKMPPISTLFATAFPDSDEDDDDDDDDKVEVVEVRKSINNQQLQEQVSQRQPSACQVFMTSPSRRMTRSQTRILNNDGSKPSTPQKQRDDTTELVDLMEDYSSSDDVSVRRLPLKALKGVSKDTVYALQRSRLAASSLRQAQQYHAEDIQVDVPETPPPNLASPKLQQSLGQKLRLTCRVQLEVNGKRQPALSDKVLCIRQRQPLQSLLDSIRKTYESAFPKSARISMTFDGMALDLSKTPAFYEMEDEDLIDVSAKAIVIPLTTKTVDATLSKRKDLGVSLVLTLRQRIGRNLNETNWNLQQREPFSNLMDQFKQAHVSGHSTVVFRFDGENIDLTKTPAAYDMETGDLIDVIVTDS